MIVAVFNPGTKHVNHTRIAVPHGNLTVSVFNQTSKKFEPANATVICDEEQDLKNCWLYTRYLLEGH